MHNSEIAKNFISPADFEMMGMHNVAYIKKVIENGSSRFGVYAANGAEIALMDVERDVAFATVRQHDMEPLSVH
ncbi:MAG: hypothetical protein CMI96_05805 [Pelagibacteraceae bacterium]|nr:hypothetical protein [Pelagibacteraceae bacterium]PPR10843.1 MAG: hypothetical protein CFH41_01420 [Alphaproteobacteria bacterium MarineAlpha11_Bin1]|tara:strand:+ start:201 stop:422 length:222 start_codon:yes stop_codon:yes gene_type:complete